MKVRLFLLAALVIPLVVRAENPSVDSGNAATKPESPLFHQFVDAACHRDEKTALALIDKGLDAKEADKTGNTALALAARFGMVATVKALVAQGADVHLKVSNSSILGFAIGSRNAEEVAFLLAHGVNANEPIDDVNLTPLMEASKRGEMDVVTMLLAQGADVKGHSQDGIDALDEAADFGYVDIIGLLIDHGADPNHGGLNDEMPLNLAARAGYLDAVKILVQKGAKVDAPNGPGKMTALAAACCGEARSGRDQIGVIQFLLQHGAKVSTPDNQGATPLMHAASSYGRLDIIKMLVAAGADIHSPDGEGAKAFRKAIEIPRPEATHAIQALLEVGANPNWQVLDDYSALFYSIEIRSNADIVAALAQAKVDVNATRQQQPMGEFVVRPPEYVYSALIAAVRVGSVPIAKALLDGGANAHYKDSEGKTALDRAREKNNPEMIALLAKYP